VSIGRTPLGFGSSSPRFRKGKKDSSPGPGSYDPKLPLQKTKGGAFSKAERFSSSHNSLSRKQLGIDELHYGKTSTSGNPQQQIDMDKLQIARQAFLSMNHPDNRSMEVGVIIPGKDIQTFSLGQIDTDYGQHRIGSVSKMFTAFLAMKLCHEGVFPNGLNTKLGDIIDRSLLEQVFENPEKASSSTLEQLLSHTSGIKYDDHSINLRMMLKADEATRSEMETIRTANTLQERVTIEGTRSKFQHNKNNDYCYSNAGYTFAGLMMEVAYNRSQGIVDPNDPNYMSFDQLIETQLFKGVFGLENTIMSPGAIGDCIQGPAGNMTTTCNDLAKVARHLQQGEEGLEIHFGKNWQAIMTRPRDSGSGQGLGCSRIGETIQYGGINTELFGAERVVENRRDVSSYVIFPLNSSCTGLVGLSDTNAFCPYTPKFNDSAEELVARGHRKVFQENLVGAAGVHLNELSVLQQVKQTNGLQKALEMAVSFSRKLGPNRQVAAVCIDSKGIVSKACSGQHTQATTDHTRFRIGSLSKFFTGVTVKKREGTGFITKSGEHSQLSGNTKLSDVFSQDELTSMFGSHHQRGGLLTVQQLMDQRSGISSQQKSDDNKHLDRQVSDLSIDELGEPTTSELLRACDAGLNLGFKFPETNGDCPFNYSNFNATLVGAVLERVCGKPFQEIMQETLFNPLGLTETGYSTPPEEQRASSFKNGGSEVWKQDEYNDSHFFDASSHMWTNAHDLTLLFQHLRSDPTFTDYFQALMETDQSQNYHAFAKTKVQDGVFSFGHDGGRDDFGSAVHMDSEGRVMIWLENANVSEVDRNSQLATGLLGMTPFHGDPTWLQTSQLSKYAHFFASKQQFNGAITVFREGQLVEQTMHSSEEMGTINPTTLFKIGSATKMFTSIAIMKLVEDGKLDFDAPIKTILGEQNCPGEFGELTVRSLLTHSSGLTDAGFDDQSELTPDELFSNIRASYQQNRSSLPLYSNAGFYLLGLVIEASSGQPYSEFIHNTFFEPIGMNNSLCDTRTRAELMKDRATNGANPLHYHIHFKSGIGRHGVRSEDPEGCHKSGKNISAAGNIISTPYDMAVFMQSMLDVLADRPNSFPISKETLLTMMDDSGVSANSKFTGLNRGLGLLRLNIDDHLMVGHPGIQEGFGCEFFVDPVTQDGVIIMNNLGFSHVDEAGNPTEEGGKPVGAYLAGKMFL